jgi:diguanylate cyclase (GGDEF)-like protein
MTTVAPSSCANRRTGDAPPRRVLLVEDNAADARLVRALLAEEADASFEITHVRRWDLAAEHLLSPGFDVVLLDLDLPDSSSRITVRRALRDALRVPIVILTGCDDESIAIAAVQGGAQDYLVKGEVEGRALVRTLRHAIERHQLVHELRQAREREHHLATHDGLTGLANRHLFFDRLAQSLQYASRYPSPVAVLYLDVDDFKVLNDTLGHPAGDALLEEVAKRLMQACRRSDTVARIGGDEFGVVLNHAPPLRQIAHLAENLLRTLSKPFRLGVDEIFIRASVGIAVHPRDGSSAESLVQGADTAMYRAKAAGGGRYRFCTSGMRMLMEERSGVAGGLADALARDEIAVYYQPLVNAPEARVVGFEALVRWRHESRGLLLPAHFVPLAEETGLIVPLGERVLERACAQIREWQKLAGSELHMAVNLSCRQLQQENLADRFAGIVRNSEVNCESIELEITESALVSDMGAAASSLEKLRASGLRIAIDDFGTGYSSLSALRRLPIDTIKLDRSFVHDVNRDARGEAIAVATIALARGMDLDLVAEGVESLEQRDFLVNRGCTYMQGELFDGALPPEVLSRRMARGPGPVSSLPST